MPNLRTQVNQSFTKMAMTKRSITSIRVVALRCYTHLVVSPIRQFMEVGGHICNNCLAGINRPPVSWLPNIRLHGNRFELDSRVYSYSGVGIISIQEQISPC
ncbi:unnamed protein product [Vicia faba]|uniref:Uncharacterized protein n=1 Tax=Vicia faba TaxID=3906 RepID=A0AAV0YYH4_VICFA|nr:unnamed protein product [Vicia faba]